jgi:hypothetical protein
MTLSVQIKLLTVVSIGLRLLAGFGVLYFSGFFLFTFIQNEADIESDRFDLYYTVYRAIICLYFVCFLLWCSTSGVKKRKNAVDAYVLLLPLVLGCMIVGPGAGGWTPGFSLLWTTVASLLPLTLAWLIGWANEVKDVAVVQLQQQGTLVELDVDSPETPPH